MSLPCGRYKHYKGGFYVLLGISEHTTTGEQLATFIALDDSLTGPRMRSRPLDEFTGTVELFDGKVVPRYQFVGDRTGHEAT